MLLCAGVQVCDLDGKKDLIKQWILEYMKDNYIDEGSDDEDESRDSGNAAVGQHASVVELLGVNQQLEESVPAPKKRAFPSLQRTQGTRRPRVKAHAERESVVYWYLI